MSLIEIIIGGGHFHFGLPEPERVTCLLCEQLGVVVSSGRETGGNFTFFMIMVAHVTITCGILIVTIREYSTQYSRAAS